MLSIISWTFPESRSVLPIESLNRKSPVSFNYTSLKTSNNFGMKKMNTSAFNLDLMNKNKKSRLAPEIEIKELHNAKNLGGSPKLYHKNNE